MSSLQAKTELVRAALSQPSTCSPATVAILSDLLIPKAESQNGTTATTKPSTTTSAPSRSKSTRTPTARSRSRKAIREEELEIHEDCLSTKERSTLATEVINATLKSLSEAIRNPSPVASRRQGGSQDAVKSARQTLRRSITAPISPLQPRSLNRVASVPSISSLSTNRSRSSSSISNTSTWQRSTAECARIAFACLRTLQAAKGSGIELPVLQLENGMVVLVGKLVSLGLDDLATKELRILKRRLENEEGRSKGSVQKASATQTPQTLAQLLDFGKEKWTGAKLELIITAQILILRLMALSRRPQHAEDAFQILALSHAASPIKLLLLAAKESKDTKRSEKIVRQFQNLSDILLSLTPSISSMDDAIALDSKQSVDPQTSIQLQTLALHCRFLWWGLANHKGDSSKDLLEPFLRSLTAFARRSKAEPQDNYKISLAAYTDFVKLVYDCTNAPAKVEKSVIEGIYRLLSSLAKEANLIDEAVIWAERLQDKIDQKSDSQAKQCSIIARLVSLRLRLPKSQPGDEELLLTLLDGLDRPLKGDTSEIEDMMTEVSAARKSAINLLAASSVLSDLKKAPELSSGLREMSETLVFLCPRLSIRYIGTSPDARSATKDIIRHEQRRQFITKAGLNAVDSSLYLLKLLVTRGELAWDLVDSKLQDCLMLLERLEPISNPEATPKPPGASYHTRISNLYYNQFLKMRQNPKIGNDNQQMRSLKRSIDCLRTRPLSERDAAQYISKLERMADLLRITGRYDEVDKTLSQICEDMISRGMLTSIAEDAAFGAMKNAWTKDHQTVLLSRTIQSLLKIRLKHPTSSSLLCLIDSTWSSAEKGAILEHQLEILTSQFPDRNLTRGLNAKILHELLHVYDRQGFPIRRLRVLLRILSLDFGFSLHLENTEEVGAELTSLPNETFEFIGTNDEQLGKYLNHYKTLAMTEVELKLEQRPDILRKGLQFWSSVRTRCPDINAFKSEVEDVEALIAHLHIISDFLDTKGLGNLRLATLRLIADIDEINVEQGVPDDVVLDLTTLGAQWLKLGYSGRAGLAFDKAISYLSGRNVTSYASLALHLSHSDYLLAIGSLNEVESVLTSAQAAYSQEIDSIARPRWMSNLEHKIRGSLLTAKAYSIYSKLALERGQASDALAHAKICVRIIRRAWASVKHELEREATSSLNTSFNSETSTVEEMSHLSMSTNIVDPSSVSYQFGSRYWALITPLFQALGHLSSIYAHHGMFQETKYYAEQAYNLAREIGSEANLAATTANLGSIWLKAGSLEKGSELLADARKLTRASDAQMASVALEYQLGIMHGLLEDQESEMAAYEKARGMLESLTRPEHIDSLDRFVDSSDDLNDKLSQLSLSKRKAPVPRKAATSRSTTVRRKAPKAKAPVVSPIAEKCTQLASMKAAILREQARVFMAMKKSTLAQDYLEEAESFTITRIETICHALAVARHLLLQSLEQMNADPVYSVLLDSTISFPSIAGVFKAEKYLERLSATKLSPLAKVRSTKGSRDLTRSASPAPGSFFDKLRQAQEKLSEIYPIAANHASVTSMHHLSSLLNSIGILLSAAGEVKGKTLAYPGFSSYSIETARTIARSRERSALRADPQTSAGASDFCWPTPTLTESSKTSLSYPGDMPRFQKEYIDIIPKTWTVVSISLSDSRNELSISKFQAGHSPFVLRLPLGRNNSIDADEEVFGFEQGHGELREILELANETAHDAAHRTGREAKAAWWEEREELDSRLKELLENIEKVWLGGFTGIFSQHTSRPDLLARFQKSFQNILDKYLPSRRKAGKRKTAARVNLDSRILDLFVGLGDASNEESDFAEPLTDLLYFVVDVLQFHGELNAYAEIDFDSIVIETNDALRSYHTAARTSSAAKNGHTILILDKALHSLPWESLPCMDGQAVSRLTSLECLRERILSQQSSTQDNRPDGHYISRSDGTYILNPDGDLKNTQTTMEKCLSGLDEWDSIVARAPSEEEIKESLESKELFLYFGHGSGAQYIRTRELRKLEKCAVACLMGCSSGALVETGEFEPYGPPINYLYAGCPALVATLWDVTDKDIDKFSKSTLEEWGLLEVEPVGRGKGKGKKIDGGEKVSLVEAVARSRKVCRLRYLNAAAVCVYGVPVYFQ